MVSEWVTGQLGKALTTVLTDLFQAVHTCAPEMAGLGIVLCGALLMITGDAGRWLGRAALIFWVATVIRVLG